VVVHNALPASFLGGQLDRRYRLDRLVGQGASAWVFAAHDLRLERDVAVKVFKPRAIEEAATQRKRFVGEGRTLAKLVHPHVVAVHDAGETPEGLLYLVMELSTAGSLEAELERRGGALEVSETLRLLLPLLGALACAHDRGIVHRDIKPANILLQREQGETRAKLLDFGIAKPRDAAESLDTALGTPSYMAPEQARGEPLTPGADVWALGVVFFRCLTGRLPFESETATSVLLKVARERAPRFSVACPSLPPLLAVALDRALEPRLARRYGDMRSFARALASACVNAGLEVSKQPEPLGLPDFERWLGALDVEETRRLSQAQQALVAEAAASDAAPDTLPYERRVGAWLLLMPAAIACAAWALWGAGSGATTAHEVLQERRQTPAALAPPLSHARPAQPAIEPAATSSPQPAITREAASSPAVSSVRRAASRGVRKPEPPAPAPELIRDAPAAIDGTKPRLITSWSWR
jgi:serine/threonine protein kinase